MFCPNCGKQLADGSAFCDQCGAAQAPVAQPIVTPTPQSAVAPASAVAKLKQKFPLPAMIALVAALLILISVFLPYMSANKETAKLLDEYGSMVALPGTDITAKDLKDVSLIEFAGIAEAMSALSPNSGMEVVSTVVYAIAILGLLTVVFAYFKKPVCIIIFSVLTYGVSMIVEAGIEESGALNLSTYDWGIGHTLLPLAVLGCIVGAIWMMVEKNKAKNAQNTPV